MHARGTLVMSDDHYLRHMPSAQHESSPVHSPRETASPWNKGGVESIVNKSTQSGKMSLGSYEPKAQKGCHLGQR